MCGNPPPEIFFIIVALTLLTIFFAIGVFIAIRIVKQTLIEIENNSRQQHITTKKHLITEFSRIINDAQANHKNKPTTMHMQTE